MSNAEIARIFQSTWFFDTSKRFAASIKPVIPPIVTKAISAISAVETDAADFAPALAAFSDTKVLIFLPKALPLTISPMPLVSLPITSEHQLLTAFMSSVALVGIILLIIFFKVVGIFLIMPITLLRNVLFSVAAVLATSTMPADLPAASVKAFIAASPPVSAVS